MPVHRSSRTPPRAEAEALHLLEAEVLWGRRTLVEHARAWWDAGLSGRAEDYARLEANDRAINRHYAQKAPFARTAELASSAKLSPLTRRRLERTANAYRAMQAPKSLLDRISAAAVALQRRYSTFRATFEGAPRSDNELEAVLATTADPARAQAAWEARKQVGFAVADEVQRLAELRNQAARANGFPDFWHQQLVLDELDPARLVRTLAAVDRATAAPFRRMKAELDRRLAAKFGVEEQTLRPWHYANPFFQEAPAAFAPPADPLFEKRDVVAMAAQTYRELGFANIDAILARSDLYPRQGKNQHAYAVDVDREGDVRAFLNVQQNARWMGTLLHELGHAVYMDGVSRDLPWDLRDDPQRLLNEGFAMFCEQPRFNPTWLARVAGLDAAEAARLTPQLHAQEKASLLAFLRFCLTIVGFERALYADPAQDLDALWWDLVERYQLLARPEGRRAPDWATKIHVATSPVYYQKYLYGRLFSAQLDARIRRRFGGWAGRADAGAYVQRELFEPGASIPWPELVRRVTGRPLGVAALASAVQWP